MLEKIKSLALGDMITIDDPNILTEQEDYSVENIYHYQSDDSEFIIIDTDNYQSIIIHTLDSETRYFICECCEDIESEDEAVTIIKGEDEVLYILFNENILSNQDEEIEILEFKSESEVFPFLFLGCLEDEIKYAYQAVEIPEDNIII